MLKLRGNAL